MQISFSVEDFIFPGPLVERLWTVSATLASDAETLPTTGQTVDFLRVGRTLLVYQTSDQDTTGWFNPTSRAFEELPAKYRLEVKEGIAIAKNEKAPNLVMLPVPGPEVAQ